MKKLLFAAFLVACACALAEVPSTVAIHNAKIVPVSGAVIAKGTVIIRNGLIDAVGENVQVPAEAWVVDGEGMTVYPGLIDSLSTIGIPGAAPAAAGGGGRGGRGGNAAPAQAAPAAQAASSERSWGPEDRPQTSSWLLAADELQAGDRRIETVRGAGITTAVTFPTRGIFGGQGSIIDLISGEKAAEMVLVPAAGQYIALGRGGGFGGGGGGGGFPSSLMGIISYVRQLYLDADHYRMAKEAYAKSPRGMQRPEYDRALEGVLASGRILIPANRVTEIDRMLRFGAELKQPMILYGARDSYEPRALELLKQANATVLLSMRWPTPPARTPDSDDSNETLRSLEQRDKAPTAPALLQKAGVKFALYSDGLDAPRDFQRAVKKAMDNGLSREDALRALTLTPAEIYGVADRMGSIEKGKIANLVITKGDIFEDRTQVVMVFVDGKKYTPADTGATGGRGGPATDDPGPGPGGNR